MLEQASKDYNIDLSASWMIGDRYTDIQAGKNAGCKTILVQTGYNGNDKDKYEIEADYIVKNLLEAVKIIDSKG